MITTGEIRKRYLEFFKKNGHQEIQASPLVLEGDPTTLFTSAGMQPLVPYLKGEPHPKGKRICDSQPSLRLQDIDEVGDNRHTTFFEMLGNWSLGDYFKKDQLTWFWKFLTEVLSLPKDRLYVSVFEGLKDNKGKVIVPKDEESYKVWLSLGVPKERIFFYGAEKNWWSRSGGPLSMPEGEIGGPDSEVFYDFGKPVHKGCHPNCDCGRFLEIGNSVFMEYEKKSGKLVFLPAKNVDFGGGLERLAMAVNNIEDIFLTDPYIDIIRGLEDISGVKYENSGKNRSFRIIADHLRAAVNILSEGIYPSNKLHGYVLRRLLRRSFLYFYFLCGFSDWKLDKLILLLENNEKTKKNASFIEESIKEEESKFKKILDRGIKIIEKAAKEKRKIDGRFAFDLYQNEGFPWELTLEISQEKGLNLGSDVKDQFKKEFEKHQEVSRRASSGVFKGGLADHSYEVVKLHTATHLLHAALRKVLGDSVSQKGSNITSERLRFDFSFPRKLSGEEIKEVEALVNKAIEDKLPVSWEEKSLKEAVKEGALHFFAEKYGDVVKVYTVGDPKNKYFSKEVCGGPHIKNTSELGYVRIIKQEKLGQTAVRIYAVNEEKK